MIVGVPRELRSGERKVALTPEMVPSLLKAGLTVIVERGAGVLAGFADSDFQGAGARIEDEVVGLADLLLKVGPPSPEEVRRMKTGAALIAFLQLPAHPDLLEQLTARRITAFAMELIPRISRAQPMDALSSMSTVAGYKAVVLAADRLPRLFPMLMTAAGTVQPARVLVVGVGVAGLQAIATARRLGGVVEAYDPRPNMKEQVESLGARFVDLGIEATQGQTAGGYARAMDQDFYRRQREAMAPAVMRADVVITSALVPGRPAPRLIGRETIEGMRPGSVIVDLAAESGGNTELTEVGREIEHGGVRVVGLVDLPSLVPFHASQMYARNLASYTRHLVRDGQLKLDLDDELTRAPLVTHEGEVRLGTGKGTP